MHKKIEAELVSLAHSILQMKNRDDVSSLHKKAHEIYEKLSVLKFVEAYMNSTSNSIEKVEATIDKIEPVIVDEVKEELESPVVLEDEKIAKITSEEKVEAVYAIDEPIIKDKVKEIPSPQGSLEEELKDAVDADKATQLFERVTKENPSVDGVSENKQRSLNDTLFKNNLQIGLNDRIAFVKHLFEGNQEDFNRVLSQLNSFKTEKEAKNFINKMVKPDYNWSDNEEYEQRLSNLIERKFL